MYVCLMDRVNMVSYGTSFVVRQTVCICRLGGLKGEQVMLRKSPIIGRSDREICVQVSKRAQDPLVKEAVFILGSL